MKIFPKVQNFREDENIFAILDKNPIMEATLTKPICRKLVPPEKKVSIEDYFKAGQSLFTKPVSQRNH